MGLSALRVAASAGVLVGALMLGPGTAGVAFAGPDDNNPGHSDEQHSKVGQTETVRQNSLNGEDAGEERQNGGGGTQPGVAADIERGGDPDGTAGGGDGAEVGGATDTSGSDHVDNTVVRVDPEPQKKPAASTSHSPRYLLQIRRDGGKWWNANQIIARFRDVLPFLAAPSPREPEPVPGPAFRGGAPEPEPVLDASGGVVGGGSDYQASGFGGAPVLSAPVVAPVPPPAAARFPAFPPTAPTGPGIGSAVARGPQPVPTAQGGRAGAPQEQITPAENTLKAMTGQAPRPGYSEYLRSPSLTNMAGAALPGIAGILLMTLGGGVIGYRQAAAGRMIRASGTARYLP